MITNTQLPYKRLSSRVSAFERDILFFDPQPLYERIGGKIKPYQRWQNGISMLDICPSIEGECSCGCGVKLSGRRTRWADKEHSNKFLTIMRIIQGDVPVIFRYLVKYYGEICCDCECGNKAHELKKSKKALFDPSPVSWLKVDHVTAVVNGGGGCWLSNYVIRCHTCHVKKTKQDIRISKSNPNQKLIL